MSDDSFFDKDEIQGGTRDLKSFIYLLRFTRPYWKGYLVSLALISSSSILMLIGARLIGSLVEHGLVQKNWNYAWKVAAIIVVLEIVVILVLWAGRKLLASAAAESILLIRKTIFSHIHDLPISYYDRQPLGRIVTRMTNDVEGIEEFFTSSLGRLIHSVALFHLTLGAMIITDVKIGSIMVLSILPAVLLTLFSRQKLRDINRKVSANNSATSAKLSEYLNGMPVIRFLGLEKWAQKNFDKQVDKLTNSQLNANAFYVKVNPLVSFLCHLPLFSLLIFGGKAVMVGTLSIGLFVAFVQYAERFYWPIMSLTREIHVIQQAFTSAERVSIFLNENTEFHELGEDGEFQTDDIEGHLLFKDITMAYDKETPVLSGVNFEVSPGEKIGIVGRTGSGKTTTVSLLARLYEYQNGDILIDGKSIRDFKRNNLRGNLGFVSQDVIIFRGTLRENLNCEASISDEVILKACEKTGFINVIKRNEMTLDSLILDGGANLSTGEKQLLSLTRILLKDPKILILDEATANVDPIYEKIIHNAVDFVMDKRTCLIIAHRLDTLKSCDRIVVFSDGKIAEIGHHEELLKNQGHFYDLHKHSLKS